MAREVDVREASEYAAGHAPGARLMTPRTAPVTSGEPPTDRPVFVVCAIGNRSRTAAYRMASRGIDAHSVTGGTGARARTGRRLTAGSHEHAA